jgi:hypothetical protein
MPLERDIRSRGMRLLKALPDSWWTKVDQRIIRDTPDDIGCFKGVLVGVEWKRSPAASPRPGQVFVLEQIQDAGGIAVVGHSENYCDIAADLMTLPLCGECGRPIK